MTYPCSSCKTECLSEMTGTYLLVLIGPSSVVVVSLFGFLSPFEALTLVALTFGMTVSAVIMLLGRRSGAHINPAITIAASLGGDFQPKLVLPYVTFQTVGGLLAGLSLWIAFGSLHSVSNLGSTKLALNLTPIEGVVIEMLGTFMLAFSALSATTIVRGRVRQGILVGSTLFVLVLLIGPLTGASFNPVRSLGPSLFSGYFAYQYVYLVGPIVGAMGAGLIFRAMKSHLRAANKGRIVCLC